jgi:hypothetical protein
VQATRRNSRSYEGCAPAKAVVETADLLIVVLWFMLVLPFVVGHPAGRENSRRAGKREAPRGHRGGKLPIHRPATIDSR